MDQVLNLKVVKELNQKFQETEILNDDSFDIINCIGAGAFGKVFKIQSKKTNKIYAKKLLSLNAIFRQNLQNLLKNEILVLANCNHKNIIKLLAIYQEDETFNLLLEYFEGQNLSQILKEKKTFSEQSTKQVIYEVTQGLYYLHSQLPPILHRDLKSENILYKNGCLKIIDFGWSNKFDEYRNTFCGTPDYFSPEMINGTGHNEKLDIWSLGILTYELLQGQPPFTPQEKNMNQRQLQKQVEKNILDGQIVFKKEISQENKDFIQLLLQQDPDSRPSAKEILNSEYLQDFTLQNVNFLKKAEQNIDIEQLIKKVDNLEKKNAYYKHKLNQASKLIEKQNSKIDKLQSQVRKSKTFEDFNDEDENFPNLSFFKSRTTLIPCMKSENRLNERDEYEDQYKILRKKIYLCHKKVFEQKLNIEEVDFDQTVQQLEKIIQYVKQQKKQKKLPMKKASNVASNKNSHQKKFLSKKSENKNQNQIPKMFISDFSYGDNKLHQKLKSFF